MKKHSKLKWEAKFLDQVLTWRTQSRDRWMIFLTHLGTGGILWILMVALFVANKKYRLAGLNMIVSMMCSGILCNIILKPLVKRDRPSWINPEHLLIGNPKDYSFPSGHTTSSFAAATTVFYYDRNVAICLLIIACLIALSRIYHYVHYPTDVVMGVLLGILCAMIGYYLWTQVILPLLPYRLWGRKFLKMIYGMA